MRKLIFIVISLFLLINVAIGQSSITIDTKEDPMIIQINIIIELMFNPEINWDTIPEGKQIILNDITNTYKNGIVIKYLDANMAIEKAKKTFDSNIRITDIDGNYIIKRNEEFDLGPLLYILKYAPAYRYDKTTKKHAPVKNSPLNTIIINGKRW